MKKNSRRAQKRIKNRWKNIPFRKIKKGDVIRLFEPDGKRVMNDDADEWICKSDAFRFINEEDTESTWCVEVDDYVKS